MKALPPLVRELWPRLKFFLKVDQTLRARSLGQKFWYPWRGLVTRNVHMKYESLTSSDEEAMAKV